MVLGDSFKVSLISISWNRSKTATSTALGPTWIELQNVINRDNPILSVWPFGSPASPPKRRKEAGEDRPRQV